MTKKTIKKSPYTYAVIAWYDYATYKKGDVISCHRTFEAACRKANQSTFWGVKEIASGDR